MGWERKRGKLQELNRLLLGHDDTTFIGRLDVPTAVRYVITLDADTRLPRGAAIRLVGTMAHPLNRPVFDARAGRVVEGYAVLQPRVTPTMPTDRDTSLFRWLTAGPAGIDPYAAATSDVYQDLFGGGSYAGKGIYDVEAFAGALEGRVPENALLSHDLFEGIFARAGLVTDIELFEEFPTDYEVAAARQHRWARGDWQLLPIIRGAAGAGHIRRPSRPSISGRWWTTSAARCRLRLADARRRLDAARPPAARVDDVRPRHDRRARPPACVRRGDPEAIRHLQAPTSARSDGAARSPYPRSRCGSRSWRIRRGSWATRSGGR